MPEGEKLSVKSRLSFLERLKLLRGQMFADKHLLFLGHDKKVVLAAVNHHFQKMVDPILDGSVPFGNIIPYRLKQQGNFIVDDVKNQLCQRSVIVPIKERL